MNGLFNRGAQYGLFVGIYLTLFSWVVILSLDNSLMNLLSLIMMALIPVGCFLMLRRTYLQEEGRSLLSGLWLEGIVAFICGSLIYVLIAYSYLRWINPGFVAQQVSEAISVYEKIDDDQAREVVNVLKQVEKTGAYPTAQQIVVQLGLLTTFIGSLLSLLSAAFIKIRGIRRK